jgi:HD-GYP domain-containing protein (c-di-GMP phosphodiesterase class II)
MEPLAALEHLRPEAGRHFDPTVYDALVRVVTRKSSPHKRAKTAG